MSNRSSTRPVVRCLAAALAVAGGVSTFGGGLAVAAPAAGPGPTMPIAPGGSVVGLERGDYGEEVKQLQEALIRVGVGVRGGVDGYFGSATQASVKAWQNYKGLPVTGVVDAATATSLGLVATAPSAPSSTGGVLANGSRGRAVAQLQLALINNGYVPTGGVDGIFGAATEGQVRRYQQAKGLPVTGQGDAATLQALGLAGGSGGSTGGGGALAIGARGTAVVEMQNRLIKVGINVPGGADGIFGPATQAALKS
ncbi:MAG: peptidoglycan-binding protein, partial [Actinomycetota bacterium]|nr:peptidoglycan-binding protein [Actinomycetota bacterium]